VRRVQCAPQYALKRACLAQCASYVVAAAAKAIQPHTLEICQALGVQTVAV
jgi:hypothetical protein